MPTDTPTFWLLNGQVGWKTLESSATQAEVSSGVKSGIRLLAAPAGPLALSSPSDDLGGLILPRGLAIDGRNRLYLAGQAENEPWIRRFDALTQTFVPLPLLAPGEQGARRFITPTAIACIEDNLYVLDQASRRVLVFDLATLVLRHVWGPPDVGGSTSAGAETTLWEPHDVATWANDAYILDRRYGRVYQHRAGAETIALLIDNPKKSGQWTRLAVDKPGDLYLLDASTPALDVYQLGKATAPAKTQAVTTRKLPVTEPNATFKDAGAVRDRFDPPPLVVATNPCPTGNAEWLIGLPARLVDELHFQVDDMKDAVRFIKVIKAAGDPLSQYLQERFMAATNEVIRQFEQGKCTSQALAQALVDELNRHLSSSQLYTAQRFAQAPLSTEVAQLTKKKLQGQERLYLNRLLLEQAYPDAFRPTCLVLYGPQIPPEQREVPPGAGITLGQALTAVPPALIFDCQGKRLTELAPDQLWDAPLYRTKGAWISQPLDSELYQCQWHRVELTVDELPAGTQIVVHTYTSERLLSVVDIANLEIEQWDTCYTFTGEMQPPTPKAASTQVGVALSLANRKDCLVQSRQGRYLWLRLDLKGDGAKTPAISALRIHYPRVSYLHYLPAVFSNDDDSRWFLERWLAVFQTEWDALEENIAQLYRYFDPRLVPASHLAYLASWLALPLEGTWQFEQQRRLLAAAPSFYGRRGTVTSIREFLQIYLQNSTAITPEEQRDYPQIVEGFRERYFLLVAQAQAANLGQGAPLWGPAAVGRLQLDVFAREGEVRLVSTGDPERDLFHQFAHRFRVFIPAAWVRTADQERMLRRALDAEKPAHTQYDLYLVEARLRVGLQSTVGIDTIIGPAPVAQLTRAVVEGARPSGAAPRHELGYDTVLGGKVATKAGVHLTPHTRVGLDTILQ